MTKRFFVFVLVLFALALANRVEAQWRAERPYRGLFAGGIGETSQLLTANASVGGGWDKNILPDFGGDFGGSTAGSGRQFSSSVGTASGSLMYSLNMGSVTFGAMGTTTGRYYPNLSTNFIRRDYASLMGSIAAGGGLTIRGSASYQPYSLRSIFPALFESPGLIEPGVVDASIANEDFPASRIHYVSIGGSASYVRRLSRRVSASASYSYQGSGVITNETLDNVRHSVRGRLSRAIGRGVSVYAGYGYSRATYVPTGRNFSNHNIDLGVDYNRALSLSLSRRTVLMFSTGSTLYQQVEPKTFRFRLTGAARLTHEMGRTWSASAAYNRGLSFVDTWQEPIFADSAVAGVGGSLGRRTQLEASVMALYGRGSSGLSGDAIGVSGSGNLSFALTRHLNTGLSYVYYRQDIAATLPIAEGFPHEFTGQSIRAYVSVWAPLFQRARRR